MNICERAYGIDVDAASKWCVEFLRSVTAELQAMKRTEWYGYKVRKLCRPEDHCHRECDTPEYVRLVDRHAEADLASFRAMFGHLGLPNGTRLEVAGTHDGLAAGWLWLEIVLPDGTRMNPNELAVDRRRLESIWEKEVLCWASSQFCLRGHAGYSSRDILTGCGEDFGFESGYADRDVFLSSLDAKDQRRFQDADFSPRVGVGVMGPEVKYYVYSEFSGVYACVATGRGYAGDNGRLFIKYNSGAII